MLQDLKFALPTFRRNPRFAALARAVIAEPSLLLADEPTAISTPRHGAETMKLFAQLNRAGLTERL